VEYEDRIRIATPEGTELDLALAGLGSRSIAAGADISIQLACVGAFALVLLTTAPAQALATALIVLFAFAITFGYDVAFEVWGGGRTPGKRLAGLRVVRSGGEPVAFVTSAVRNVMRLVDILPFFYGVGMATIFFSRHNQRLGDVAAGTVVIRERHAADRLARAWAPAPDAAAPAWDVSGVSARDAATLAEFLARRERLDRRARRDLAADLRARLAPGVAGAPPGLDDEDFLEGVAAAKAAR
jgi:uncharacterized RDD family membrane protein YckC